MFILLLNHENIEMIIIEFSQYNFGSLDSSLKVLLNTELKPIESWKQEVYSTGYI